MKANELRIGNILNYNTAEGDVLPAVIDWQDLKWLSEDPEGFNLAHSPIPLNEEWLKRMGFDTLDERYFALDYEDLSFRYYYNYLGGVWKFRLNFILVKIQHVHQLQNLYFALTGEELEVKH